MGPEVEEYTKELFGSDGCTKDSPVAAGAREAEAGFLLLVGAENKAEFYTPTNDTEGWSERKARTKRNGKRTYMRRLTAIQFVIIPPVLCFSPDSACAYDTYAVSCMRSFCSCFWPEFTSSAEAKIICETSSEHFYTSFIGVAHQHSPLVPRAQTPSLWDFTTKTKRSLG